MYTADATFAEADAACAQDGAVLATFRTEAEYAAVQSMYGSQGHWIGIKRYVGPHVLDGETTMGEAAGELEWADDGSSVADGYTAWMDAVFTLFNEEDIYCVYVLDGAELHDRRCSVDMDYLCQI